VSSHRRRLALAKAIPGAKLVVIPEMGHLFRLGLFEQVTGTILEHLSTPGMG
jgi:hypothetical protein